MKTFFTAGLWLCLFLCSANFIHCQPADHQALHLMFKDSVLHVKAVYTARPESSVDSLWFILNPGVELDTIKAPGLISYDLAQKQGRPFPYRLLKFDETIAADQPIEINFIYTIHLAEQNHMRSRWIELNADKLWYPNREDLDNKFTAEVYMKNFPSRYDLFTYADAELLRIENEVTIRRTTPWYEVLILAGEDMEQWAIDDNITIYANSQTPDSLVNSIGMKVKESIAFLNDFHGGTDPIQKFRVVLRNTSRKEIGFQFNRGNMIVTGTDFNDHGNLAHEIAHYWWNKASFIEEPWLNESFANYSTYKVLWNFDQESLNKVIQRTKKITENTIPVSEATLFAQDAYPSFYHKGALHLLALEKRVGIDAMKKLLTACVDKDVNTTNEFLQEINVQVGEEQEFYFRKLLEQ